MTEQLSNVFVNFFVHSMLFYFSLGSEPGSRSNECIRPEAQANCGTCIGVSGWCHWCKAPDFEVRCDFLENLKKANCSSEDIISPQSELTPIKNESTKSGSNIDDPIQLSPQEIKINLRPNKTFEFSMVFRQAENYPVDLYFIMDVSHTMRNYKETLGKFSQKLVDEIRKITTDYQLGFGTFVDKATLPYINTAPDQEIPCDNCTMPYGFRNQLRLTSNESEFKGKIDALNLSGNLDAPEGGFDAIMQAAACGGIGWRTNSRKMILFSTDGSFHYAGDGKLGGIVIPNDGHCHLNSAGYYTESLNQDYPSVSQLSNKISEKKINVIFVVPEAEFSRYNSLSSFIVGSNVGKLDVTSSNVIDLVKDNYNKIQSEIELKTENVDDDIRVTFRVECPDKRTYNVPRCEKLKIGESVKFNVSVQASSCLQRNRTLKISPIGLTEKLTVHLELICECPCELPGQEEKNSMKCNSSGTYECGICTCNSGYKGKKCECGGNAADSGDHEDIACRKTNLSEVCQGKGRCECGQCICNPINSADQSKRYSGRFCECNDYSCQHDRGIICGGLERGKCVCGMCLCEPGYNGTRCECSTNTTLCKTKEGGLCNGKGICKCGECECTDSQFKGPKCEECPTCPGDKCEENGKCADCHLNGKTLSSCSSCPKVELVDSISDVNDKWKKCLFRDAENCNIAFVYSTENNYIKAEKSKKCIAPTSNIVIIAAVVGSMIAFGLICVCIWKIVVTYYDRKEYRAFLKEQGTARWSEKVNPIYKEATSNFKNPAYKPGSR